MAKCNLPAEERAGILNHPAFTRRTNEELEQLRDYFENFLIVDTDGQKNYREYHCTRCHCWVGLDKSEARDFFKLHHNDYTNCPQCGERVQIKMLGRLGNGGTMHQTTAVSFINVSEEGSVFISSGIAFANFDRESMDFDIDFRAKRRYYMRQGAVMAWKRWIDSGRNLMTCWRGWGEWEEMRSINEPFQTNPLYGFDGYGYFIGLEKLQNSCFKYCAIDKYFLDYHNVDTGDCKSLFRLVPQYLAEYAMRPQIEMAVKLGLCDVVGKLVRDKCASSRDINWQAKNPADFLRLNKEDTKEFLCNPHFERLHWYHQAKKVGIIKSMAEASNVEGRIGIPSDRLVGVCARQNIKLSTAATKIGSKLNAELWADYVSMAESLHYDLSQQSELFPKDLKARHDAAAENLRIMKDEEKDKAYQKRRTELEKKYGYSADGLRIVVPRGIEDIVREGKTLHHCVGGYAHRHVEGKTTILFLRRERKLDTPFLTIELDKAGNIVQIHGYKNEHYAHSKSPKMKYAKWIADWQSWYKRSSHRKSKKEVAA